MMVPFKYIKDQFLVVLVTLALYVVEHEAHHHLQQRMHNPSTFIPDEERAKEWATLTHSPFDPYIAIMHPFKRTFYCPRCPQQLEARQCSLPPSQVVFTDFGSVAFITNGRGYAQKDFTMQCSRCGLIITHQALRVAKFLHPFTEDYLGEGSPDTEPLLPFSMLVWISISYSNINRGSLYTPGHRLDTTGARNTKLILLSHAAFKGTYLLRELIFANYHAYQGF
jgi:hypothetical protein